jgi:hypothetical protein
MVLSGEDKVNEEDSDEGEDNSSEKDLYWERPRKGWPVL